jgi:hypothetical protein
MRTGGLRRPAVAVFVVAVVAAVLGIGVRASFGAHVAVDEPQYALTALSLAEDGDLDISDELAQGRWRAFADREPPVQTEVLAGGRQFSPHDPLLPILLAAPMGLFGWVAAKATLALLAGVLAVLTLWVAVRRFGIDRRLATLGVALASASAPLAVYGQQIYPELPAALVTLGAVALLTGEIRTRQLAGATIAVVALPWLSVKYVPVAAALAAVAAVRWWRAGRRRDAALFAGVLVLCAAGYLALHRLVWGGWTVYATGDHFQRSGEFGVIGFEPDFVGRGLRLAGLLVDRGYGLVAWQPAWLLIVPAVAALLARRPRGAATLAAPLTAGWLVATFVALTMHGAWWPGRQLVVVLPLAAVVVLWWLDRLGPAARVGAAVLGAAGVLTYAGLLIDGYARRITWVSHFQDVNAPVYRALRPLLPDYRGDFLPLHLAWSVVLIALLVAGWRHARRPVLAAQFAPGSPSGGAGRPPSSTPVRASRTEEEILR